MWNCDINHKKHSADGYLHEEVESNDGRQN